MPVESEKDDCALLFIIAPVKNRKQVSIWKIFIFTVQFFLIKTTNYSKTLQLLILASF